MPVTMVIVAIALVLGAAMWWAVRTHRADPADPEWEDRAERRASAEPTISRAAAGVGTEGAGTGLLAIGFFIVATLATVAGAMFDMMAHGVGFARLDEAVAEWGASHATATGTEVMRAFTALGGTGVVIAVGVAVAAYGLFVVRRPQVVWFTLLAIGGQAVVVNVVKWIVDRRRPDLAQLAGYSGSSFPSGHSAAAATTYAVAAIVLTIGAGWAARAALAGLATGLASIVAATRALLGVHWLTDVVAGVAVGWAWFMLCVVLFGGSAMRFGAFRDAIVRRPPDAAPDTGS